MQKLTIEKFEEKIRNKWPEQPFEVISFSASRQPCTIKCLRCGAITTYSRADNYTNSNRKGVCYCYNQKNALTKHDNNKKEILRICEENENIEFQHFGYKEETRKYTVTVLCNRCGQSFTKTWQDFLKNCECYYCQNKQKMNTQAFKTLLSDEYTLLSEYEGAEKRITIKHNPCGFIWKPKAHSFLSYIGCPQCNHKRSQGERKIENFLDKNFIPYEIEKSFNWQTNLKRRYDFYLPEQKLVIEYMGEQHFRERPIFQITLKEQQRIDEEKRLDALNNGFNYLAIPYTDFLRIEEILTEIIGSTTNLQGVDLSRSKRKTSENSEEDIV